MTTLKERMGRRLGLAISQLSGTVATAGKTTLIMLKY